MENAPSRHYCDLLSKCPIRRGVCHLMDPLVKKTVLQCVMIRKCTWYVHYQCDTTQALEGDPKYLAPELMQGRFTKSADIFRYRSESLFTNKLFIRFLQGTNFYCFFSFTIHFYADFIFIVLKHHKNLGSKQHLHVNP